MRNMNKKLETIRHIYFHRSSDLSNNNKNTLKNNTLKLQEK